MTQFLAVDWSGRARGAGEHIWLARVVDGCLAELDNGFERGDVIDRVIALSREDRRCVVGLDFAFAFPAWYAARREWTSGRQIWDAMGTEAERLLEGGEPLFWGRLHTHAQTLGAAYRATEASLTVRPKSVFQIAGAGAVGTGSLRGMPYLARLSDAGFAVWPFDDPAWPLAVEIYPRLFVPNGVVKSRHRARRQFLEQRFPSQPAVLRERAAGSEDAFDAAVSALAMAEHAGDFDALAHVAPGAPERIEGAIWMPRSMAPQDS